MIDQAGELIEARDRETTRPVTDWARIRELTDELARIAAEQLPDGVAE